MISDLGYGFSGAAYLLLLLLLFTVRKGGLAKYLLILSAIVTVVWSVAHISLVTGTMTLERLLFIDIAKQSVWLLFLAAFLRDDFATLWDVLKRPVSIAILALPAGALVLPYFIPMSFTWRFLLQTVIALEVLILLEQVYRQSGTQRWAFKPLVLYLGVLNLFEFVTYANATMVAQVEPIYIAARGYIYVLMVPFLVIATRRIKHWGVDIFISREVVLHSSLLLVAGGYLFVMAAIGYAIKFVGGSWGPTIQIVLIALSIALLVTVFLSNNFRTQVKVFITKNFFANQFDYRIEWVKLTQTLSAEGSALPKVYGSALQGYLGALNYDSGAIIKIKNAMIDCVASSQCDVSAVTAPSLMAKLRAFFTTTEWIMDVDEYRVKPYLYSDLKLSEDEVASLKGHILIPIFQHEKLWGIVVLGCVEAERLRLNWELRDYLNAATAQISNFIFHHEASNDLAENAQFAAFSRMSAFVVHDLKNVLAQIDLILCNAQQHKHNPEFIDDTFETLEHTKSRMDKMLRQLTDKLQPNEARAGSHLLSSIIEHVLKKRCAGLKPTPTLDVEDEVPVVIDAEKFANVVYHLVNNAQQATADSGTINIELAVDQDRQEQVVTITDSGEGMSQEFIEQRLFKPFETTKGNAGMGIGVYDARSYIVSINGRLSVESEQGTGTQFTLRIPSI
ncbi:XrtA/PEP-CTERM system histidine kinase PrsK [Alteromonas oceanisediminis]|uniref:XrtA/PEP-CTERM system histidine kinase PrsK n=1 Tax=Alteromonas oceanisediminis TaxID=2836180 RepID=UPI001BDA22FA|nr:XrtA/PEP-CTERM system histidine kinase PrsK [Alteromonas oceanisediminis]MBT0585506.1 PEP-CTERM system histidine kinase PrsK [Alteromonas oceanisediminis]